jgi:Zn-dependent protease
VFETAQTSSPTITTAIPAPEPVFNCPNCSLWLPPGSLACPDCHTLVYGRHLEQLARNASQLEVEQRWAEAREAWHAALAWLPPTTKQAAVVQQHIDTIDARAKAADDSRAKWTKRLGPFAPLFFFLLKAKTFLLAILKFKFLLSFVAFFGIYWAIFGWRFGLGFTLAILLHELGHYIAVRRRGLKADLPVFLPGLGAYVRWYAQGMSLDTLAEIALAGPAAGLLTAIACLAAFRAYGGVWGVPFSELAARQSGFGAPLFGSLAHVGAWLNLLNLVPVFGLDGAQATYALDRTQRALVLGACIVLFALLHEAVFLFIAVGMAWRLFSGPVPQKPSSRTMIGYMLLLFTLGAVLWVVPEAGR